MSDEIRIVVVEDEEMIRGLFVKYLKEYAKRQGRELCVVGDFSNGREALKQLRTLRPHIVFTDIKMPYMDGLELAKEIHDHFPAIYTVIITGFSEFEYAKLAIRCGVFDYLLKPVQNEKVAEILESLSSKIRMENYITNRDAVYSAHYSVDAGEEQGLFLIQIGNNSRELQNETLIRYFKAKEAAINWGYLFPKIGGEDLEWILTDENLVNVKALAVKVKNQQAFDCRGFAEKLLEELKLFCGDININICYRKELVVKQDIWKNIKYMRKNMNQFIAVGESRILSFEDIREWRNSQKILEVVKNRINGQLVRKIQAGNREEILREIQSTMQFVEKQKMFQNTYERIVEHLFHVLEISKRPYDADILEEMMQVFYVQLCLAKDYPSLNEYVMGCVEIFLGEEVVEEEIQIEQFLDYVNQNFIQIESVKSVADKFNYNYTYFSRMFKEYTGVSMNRYITQKRIEMAKMLLEQKEGLGISAVCQMVGYEDQHYFSRVFKKETGVSPSDYKNNGE